MRRAPLNTLTSSITHESLVFIINPGRLDLILSSLFPVGELGPRLGLFLCRSFLSAEQGADVKR